MSYAGKPMNPGKRPGSETGYFFSLRCGNGSEFHADPGYPRGFAPSGDMPNLPADQGIVRQFLDP